MRHYLCLLAGVVAALGVICQGAQAQPKRAARQAAPEISIGPLRLGNPNVFAAGLIAGGAMTGTYIAIEDKRSLRFAGERAKHFNGGATALTTVGCMALSPMLAAALVYINEGRNLTRREALGLGADCIIPFLGSLIWNAAYDAHPEWPE